MSKTSREKIALIIFFCLIFIGLGTTVAYLNIGHSWNVAASNIDDATGDMLDYTAILYEGTAPLAVEASNDVQPSSSEGTTDSTVAATGKTQATDALPPSSTSGSTSVSSSSSSTSSATSASTPTEPVESGSDNEGVPILNANAADKEKEKKPLPVPIAEVEKSYQDKKATVFVLDVMHPAQYADGMILRKGNHRFGVFSVAFNQSVALTEKQIAYFKQYHVDFIVAITPDKKFVEKATGIDIVISLQDEGLFLMGETIGGTFYVDAPPIGQVGAILISPHSVVSSKDITEI
ncbi:MAG: alcohol dehydrogenase [Raoultibacter sp.]